MSEPAPERQARPGRPAGPGKPKGKQNVFTRKIGPLPMWVWVAIIAGAILLYALYKGHKASSSSGTGTGTKTGGFGRALLPPEVITRTITRRGRRKRGGGGGGDDDDDKRKRKDDDDKRDDDDRKPKHHHKGSTKPRGRKDKDHDDDDRDRDTAGTAHPMVRVRTQTRGQPAPGELSAFKTSSRGGTPSLQQVADGFSTTPDAIIQESSGRGVPHGQAWNRYVRQGDYSKSLPNGVDMAILDRTQ